MKSIILIAPPAAGKGTQSGLISSKYGIPSISTGLLLRNAIVSKNKRAQEIRRIMDLGNLVSDDIIMELLTERLSQHDCDKGYILDGFPRNLEQAKYYDEVMKKMHKEIDYVFVLDLPIEVLKQRIEGRISCPKCGLVYNTMFEEHMPKIEGICDKCGTKLLKRDDDNEETYDKRYQTYTKSTKPLIKYYEDKGIVFHIDSTVDAEYTFSQIDNILREENL